MLSYGTVDELRAFLSGGRKGIELDRAALQLAALEYPGLDIRPFLEILDSHGSELRARLSKHATGAEFVRAANSYLFSELGFVGNSADYYDPRNSCLNEVLVRRLGIPITLSVVYMEVARRLNRPVSGVGLPGHFLVRYDDGAFAAFIDPFHAGAILTPQQCFALAREATGARIEEDSRLLAPVSARQILLRMLANLRGVYLQRRATEKALGVVDLLLSANPDSLDDLRVRGMLYMEMRRLTRARADFERYLRIAPRAPDRTEIAQKLQTIAHLLARMN